MLSFVTSTWSILLGVLAVVVVGALGWMAWRRNNYARGSGMLEALRVLLVALVAITLNQPEWLEQYLPDEQPTLLVLSDTSGSMNTQDVLDPNSTAAPPRPRAEVAAELVGQQLGLEETSLDVVFKTFSSTLDQPAEGTDIHAALAAALEEHSNLRGIVLLSDGDWNVGDPPARMATVLRTRGIPVYAVGIGSESRLPDIELVRIDAPTFGVRGKPMRIPFIVESSLPRDYVTRVTLKTTSGDEITQDITIPAMGRLEETLNWLPEETGEFELTISVPPQATEFIADNNELTVPIAIREEALNVLLVESYPRWEYRYLRNALQRDPGVEVSCLLFHPHLTAVGGGKDYLDKFPTTLEELSKFDVIFLGDVGVGGGQLTAEQCRLIKGLVQSQASGLIFMPGLRGEHLTLMGTELEELYPVVLNAAQLRGWGSRTPSQFELTETGRRSLLTELEPGEEENALLWESLPGFQWYAAVLRAKAGTSVLATHKTDSNEFGRIPLLVTKTFGTGKVLFMGTDAAWRWREGVEDKYHYRFWGQVARWMAYQRSMTQGERVRLFYSPDRPYADGQVTLYANLMSDSGEPLREGNVVVQVMAPSGKPESVKLSASDDEWGLFTGTFTPREYGEYKLLLSSQENDARLETTLAVQGVGRERLGQPIRTDVLEELAVITRGKVVQPGELGSLASEIAELPEPDPIIRRLRIWCHPLWAGTIVTLLGIFWAGRKMYGMI